MHTQEPKNQPTPAKMTFHDFPSFGHVFARWLVRAPGRVSSLPAQEGDPWQQDVSRLQELAEQYPFPQAATDIAQLHDQLREAERDGAPVDHELQRRFDELSLELQGLEDRWLKKAAKKKAAKKKATPDSAPKNGTGS